MTKIDPRLTAIQQKHAEVVRARGSAKGRAGWQTFGLQMPWRFLSAIDTAARRRGISRASYIRRVLAYWVAADLETDPQEYLGQCPWPIRWGEASSRAQRSQRDDGTGFGSWDLVRRD